MQTKADGQGTHRDHVLGTLRGSSRGAGPVVSFPQGSRRRSDRAQPQTSDGVPGPVGLFSASLRKRQAPPLASSGVVTAAE